jgi:hypothetical protein
MRFVPVAHGPAVPLVWICSRESEAHANTQLVDEGPMTRDWNRLCCFRLESAGQQGDSGSAGIGRPASARVHAAIALLAAVAACSSQPSTPVDDDAGVEQGQDAADLDGGRQGLPCTVGSPYSCSSHYYGCMFNADTMGYQCNRYNGDQGDCGQGHHPQYCPEESGGSFRRCVYSEKKSDYECTRLCLTTSDCRVVGQTCQQDGAPISTATPGICMPPGD